MGSNWAEQIVEAKDVNDVERGGIATAPAKCAPIPGNGAVTAQNGKVERFDAVFLSTPTPGIAAGANALLRCSIQAEICSEDRDLMTARGKPSRKRTHFYGWPSLFEEGIVGLGDIQDAHAGEKTLCPSLHNTEAFFTTKL
jgi:hypothetical protein